MHKCPRCNGKYQKQGLHDHLRMRHGLHGEELKRAYRDALGGSEKQRGKEATERRSVPSQGDGRDGARTEATDTGTTDTGKRERKERGPARANGPYQALDKLRKAKGRM